MAHPAPTSDWIEWTGGECPVAPKTIVDVRYRDGATEGNEHAGVYDDCGGKNWWKHEGASYSKGCYGPHHADIIAYRVVQS